MANSLQEAQRQGQSIWYDNIRRGLLTSGELEQLISQGVTGVTSNPTIFEKAIAGSTDYDQALLPLARAGVAAAEAYKTLALEDIGSAADLLRPAYDASDGVDGYVSLEVSPTLAHDTEGTVAEAHRLFASLDRPNVMIKVPATPEGVPAVRRLIGGGINVNVTLIFSLESYRQVAAAYIAGLEELAGRGGDLAHVASVASFFVSRIDTVVDSLLEEAARGGRQEAKALLGQAAIANAKLAYRDFKETFGSARARELLARGARVQRPLWASTGTKDPAYSDVLYVESLMGPQTVNTVPPQTLTAFLEHGTVEATLERDVSDSQRVMEALERVGVSMAKVTAKLLADGVKSFADSFDKLLENIDEKRSRLLAQESGAIDVSLGAELPHVDAALADLRQREAPARIWRRDHTVWRPEPTEISNRLGWLATPDAMTDLVPGLESFAREIRDEGYRDMVLLGMGGSSLGSEVLRRSLGSAPGYPWLTVLDSTVPACVSATTEAIDPAHTLFIVSSKSGGTIETLSAYRHFRALVEQAVGSDAGAAFVAITDAETPLHRLAKEEGFRRVLLNSPDIGGRYSVLSYFGMAPASLAGMDVASLLDRAARMAEGCESCVPVHENPGAWLGAVMGSLARRGRDKLTLIASPSIAAFGPWAEQLIAESTGKDGTGIVPVVGEPLLAPSDYGDDRLFIHLRLAEDDNEGIDAAVERIRESGHPVVRLELRDRYDLGAEFFRWEFATAVASSILGVHPFDQPDVQRAKELTAQVLGQYAWIGTLLESPEVLTSGDLLARAEPGSYLAIMAYLRQTPETDRALEELRRRVAERYRIATTVGYGPRFLHSTGQLHKGGPASGLFLQLTQEHTDELPVPGEGYTFGVLADAQALGDSQALSALGRPLSVIHLGRGDAGDGILRLANGLG